MSIFQLIFLLNKSYINITSYILSEKTAVSDRVAFKNMLGLILRIKKQVNAIGQA